MKKNVLIMGGYYIPSVKGGGPIQSIRNLVDNLSDKINFYIVTLDRDLGDDKPFRNIKTDTWLKVGKAKVYYTNQHELTWRKTESIINSVDYDVLYLNSFFDYKFSTVPILLKKYNKIPWKPIVLSPRGQFSPGALVLKSGKKKLFINITRVLGLYNGLTWHATSDVEKKDIEKLFGEKANIIVANNLTANYEDLKLDKEIDKNKGELKVVFISRIHPKKNLKKAIQFLNQINGKVEFNIFGPLEDSSYWSECEVIIKSLPSNIKVEYKGVVEHDRIMNVFKEHHVFLFPTLGENYGHVISEALISGCPVIISNQTPWRELESKHVGWDIDLKDEYKFISVIQLCMELNNEEYKIFSTSAFNYGKKKSNQKEELIKAYSLFE
ncbi:MAG: glycosyltransferase [Clostridiales bacterium]|nr:glycosyltransferase [Clostridiales bacterium]